MKIKFGKGFSKQFDKSPQKVKSAFEKRLELFKKDKFNPLLNNHALGGKYKGYRSINVTGNWRAIFREFEEGGLVFFDAIGTHPQLYG